MNNKIGKIKFISIIAFFILIFTTSCVYASAPQNKNDYGDIEFGGDIISISDANGASTVTIQYSSGNKVEITGNNLYSEKTKGYNGNNEYVDKYFVYANGDVTIKAIPVNNYSAVLREDGNLLEGDTKVYTGLSHGSPKRLDAEFYDQTGPNPPGGNQGIHYIEGAKKVSSVFNYTKNGEPADIWVNDTAVGVGEPAEGSKEYYYVENTGKVDFKFGILVNSRLTKIKINGIDYTNQLPKTSAEWLEANHNQFDIVEIKNVPYSATYNIETTSTHNFEWSIGNFLWSYMDKDKNNDDYIGNGKLDFVSLEFNGKKYNGLQELNSANKDYLYFDGNDEEGGAVLPAGAKLTVRLVPNSGYQLVAFYCNGQKFETGKKVGYYTFEVPKGNFHWGATFSKVNDVVNASSSAIESGTIKLSENETSMEIGTARLDVKDVNVSNTEKSNFEKKAGDYSVTNYLDISLFNTVYKGSENSSWDTAVSELDNKASISLKLDNINNEEDVEILHEKHDGTYEVVASNYNANNKSISFNTNSFSKYAIAIKKKNIVVPFKDTAKTAWYYNAVSYVYENNIIKGYNSDTFAPNDKLTRGMLATIIYRMEGEQKVTGTPKFPDVQDSNKFYYKAIKWATDNKIVAGYDNGNFGPDDNITREQLAVILNRYARSKGKDMTKSNNLNKFSDVNNISSYALNSIKWAVGSGVITGNADGTINPKGNATRAEVAAMLEKYCKRVGR